VLADDPRLDVRHVAAPGGQPRAIVLDGRLRTPPEAAVARPGTIVLTGPDADPADRAALEAVGVEVHAVPCGDDGHLDLPAALAALAGLGITSVLAEPGATLAGALMAAGVVDRLVCHIAPDLGAAPLTLPVPTGPGWRVERLGAAGADLVLHLLPRHQGAVMFTGIVEEIGRVDALERHDGHARLHIGCREVLDGVEVGDSIAVSGCCVTVTELSTDGDDTGFVADLMAETLLATSLGDLEVGSQVNLERALRADDRLGGHLVQGHVDGVGEVVDREEQPGTVWLTVTAPPSVATYLVPKGSVTVDGASLTVVDVREDEDVARPASGSR
jgi:riboflavin synthase